VTDIYRIVVAVAAATVGAAHATRLGMFILRCFRGAAGEPHRLNAAQERLRRTGAQLFSGKESPDQEKHRSFVESERARLNVTLVVGSIGLAAWSQLFVSSKGDPGDDLHGLTLGLLLGGSASLLAAPLLWRAEGLYLTTLGREAALDFGYACLGFALASVVVDLDVPVLAPLAVVLTALIAGRQVAEARTKIRLAKPVPPRPGLHYGRLLGPGENSLDGVHHVQLEMPLGAEETARGFYTGVLGMREADQLPGGDACGGLRFAGRGLQLHLQPGEEFRPTSTGHPGILVSNVHELACRLQAANQQVAWSVRPGFLCVYALDPFGNRLEFLQSVPAPSGASA
jgi:catechol 2,3-dioxygenase-like lactoylglutathione lyase family enzyme